MSKKHTLGWLNKQSKSYFGICYQPETHKIIVASRECLSLRKYNKPTTDVKLFAIDPETLETMQIATIRDVHDVHQICCDGDLVYLTDTGKNRIVVYSLSKEQVIKYINIGDIRDDIHHINAILMLEEELLVGLNNRGEESQVLRLDIANIMSEKSFEVEGISKGKVVNTVGVSHSHDLEVSDDMLLCCSSHRGLVVDTITQKPIVKAEMWVRGLAANQNFLWVGASFVASRKERHGREIDGQVYQYNKADWSIFKCYTVKKSGQINDLIIV